MSPAANNQPAEKPHFSLGYRPELDGLRGVSILLVLALHFAPALMPGGFFGVDIFFVLSGFLITSLLLDEWGRQRSISLKDFYIRRVLRLGPALAVYLFSLGAYAFLFSRREIAHQTYSGILLTLSYISNWVIALKFDLSLGILTITWSLAVEEQFYLLWPLLLLILLKSKLHPRGILVVLSAAVMSVAVHRGLLWVGGASVKRMYYGTDTHADGLLLGCLVGCLVSWNYLPPSRLLGFCLKTTALTAVLVISYLAFTTKYLSQWLYAGGFTLVSLAIAMVLAAVVVWPASRVVSLLRFRPLVWIGRVSYGLYLWHWPVRGFVFGSTSRPSAKQIVAGVGLSFAVTALSFYAVEQPFLALKRRFGHVGDAKPHEIR